MKGITIIEENDTTGLINLAILNQVLIDPEIYKMPSFLPENISDRELVEKYKEKIQYTGNFRDGYIYQHAITAARLIEQQQYLFDAVSENDKQLNERQLEFLRKVFHEKKPVFLRSDAAGDQGTSLTYLPVYRFLGVDETTGEVLAQFGIRREEVPAETLQRIGEKQNKPWPYAIYRATTPRSSIQYAYILARNFQEKETVFIARLLETYDDKIRPQLKHLIQAVQLKKAGEVNSIGTDFVSIKHIDPHEGFVFSAERAYLDLQNQLQYTRFSIPFQSKAHALEGEFSLYKKAILYGEVLIKLLDLKTSAILSNQSLVLESQLADLMNVEVKHYSFAGGKLGNKEIAPCKIVEIINSEQDLPEIMTVLIPELFFQQQKMVAYLFAGSLLGVLQGKIYEETEPEKKLVESPTSQLPQPPILGGAIYYPENHMIHFVDSFRNPLSQLWVSEKDVQEKTWSWLVGMLLKFVINKK